MVFSPCCVGLLVRERKCISSKLQHEKYYSSVNSAWTMYSVGPGEAIKCLGSAWKASPRRWHFSWGFWKMSQYLPCRNQFSLSSNKWGLKRQTSKLFIQYQMSLRSHISICLSCHQHPSKFSDITLQPPLISLFFTLYISLASYHQLLINASLHYFSGVYYMTSSQRGWLSGGEECCLV